MRTIKLMGLALIAVLAMSAIVAASASAIPATYLRQAGKETVTYTVNGKTKSKPCTRAGSYTDKGCTAGAPPGTNGTTMNPKVNTKNYQSCRRSPPTEENEIKALLKYVKVETSGIDSKPTVQVSGANLQVVAKPTGEGGERERNHRCGEPRRWQ